MRDRIAAITPFLAMLVVGLLACGAYWPGLHGDFLFDDFGNLPTLGAYGPIDNCAAFWRYITSGIADPTGRPLALLTFLLDARNWPAEPWPFKRTNLLLHLCNGVLLFILLTRLGQALSCDIRRSRNAALLGSALWLLHPLLVSTTLYIVQREAMLPATCVMAGLLLWLHGRHLLTAGRSRAGVLWITLGLGACTALGILAKANGALLPLYALLIEIILLATRLPLPAGRTRSIYRVMLLLFAVIPSIALLVYLVRLGLQGVLTGGTPGIRSWTVAQRLMTEPRVLMDYLHLLWLPRPFSSGLFNDQYVASTSWLQPISTLPSMIAVILLIALAWWMRRRHPAFALALLFYFGGQLMESTSIALELYFEHRNYVPALLMFWPLGLWLSDQRSMRLVKLALMVMLPLALAWMTRARADLWGNPQAQALIWARINPDSPRAQANAADVEMQSGNPHRAAMRLERLLADQSDQAQLIFNLIDARCMMGGLEAGDIVIARKAMQSTPNTGALFIQWSERTLPMAVAGTCPGLTSATLLELIDAGLQNPKLSAPGPQQDLVYLRGRVALALHQPDAALTDFIRALDLQVRPGMALKAAATLGSAGYAVKGLDLLDHYQQVKDQVMQPNVGMPMLHDWVLKRQHYWPHELVHLRTQLERDAASAARLDPSHPSISMGANR